MITCGLWTGRGGLVAVLLDRNDRKRYCHIAPTHQALAGFACWLTAAGADLVMDDRLLASNGIARVARRAGVAVWIAALPLVAAILRASGLTRASPRSAAALLARLPTIPWMRAQLRRLEPDDERQIVLL